MESRSLHTPAEIARESIKQLARQRIAPTPENFAAAYYEVSGEGQATHQAVPLIKQLVRGMRRFNPGNGTATMALESAIDQQDWGRAERLVTDFTEHLRQCSCADWPKLTADLVHNLDIPHSGWTPARKRDSVQHVLSAFETDAQKARDKLSALIHSWSNLGTAGRVETGTHPEAVNDDVKMPHATQSAEVVPLDRRVTRTAEAEACERLTGLLRMLCNNIGVLVPDASWLKGQMERVDLLLTPPFDHKRLSEAESSLRAAVSNQVSLKDELEEAKAAIKEILATLIDRLGSMTDSTGDFYTRVDGYSQQIASADDIASLNEVVKGLLGDTEKMQEGIRHTRDELIETRHKSEKYAERVHKLEEELAKVSEMVKTDQLTQALNRRGFDEAMSVELARAQRQASPLCLAMLDLDNFKRLNDAHGHQVGDQALVHLTRVVREIIRPTDVVARLGGEEFVIMLPETSLEEGVTVVSRLQRQLTREFFLGNEEKLFITFSAGVAEFATGETREEVLHRADCALYDAKRQGKNRVVAALPSPAHAPTRQARA